ncbi:DUF2254 domain-containing protein [Breoghania sp. L-A4]|uniref:DUF2254 domain-containing protein n=1 Tax=Breoghania sp. L-A4 TaxID=2304600 RepID=UPI000E35D7FE|nr:DUF2254 domain-containing protein [Breoghania sp. L-A4]AXS40217.1 DUF2254 domain-containing protein [Breoghania sp. L-A4]
MLMFVRVITARLARSFMLVPALIGLTGILSAVAVVHVGDGLRDWVELVFPTPALPTVRTVLATIAGAALTVLSLVYSLTLVVFTLAAGNIGPRLLTRFTEDNVIQVTAGALAATFFYSILLLQRSDTNIDHALSTGGAVIWSVLSICLVIVFIHNVATRITIDEEIARIGRSLSGHIEMLIKDSEEEEPAGSPDRLDDIRPDAETTDVASGCNGYVDAVDVERLRKVAAKHDLFIEVIATPGQFVVRGSPLLSYSGTLDEDGRKALKTAFMIAHNRTPEADLDFSILLMVEIAQRALSPGLNDGFTAIAVIDHLSGAFSKILTRPEPSSVYRDKEGKARVWCELVSVERLLGTAFHPLRRDGMSNLTVVLRLLAAIERLGIVARPGYRDFLAHHVELIVEDANAFDFNDDDRAELGRACDRVWKVLDKRG